MMTIGDEWEALAGRAYSLGGQIKSMEEVIYRYFHLAGARSQEGRRKNGTSADKKS